MTRQLIGLTNEIRPHLFNTADNVNETCDDGIQQGHGNDPAKNELQDIFVGTIADRHN